MDLSAWAPSEAGQVLILEGYDLGTTPTRGWIRREAARLTGSGVDLEQALALPIGQVSLGEAS